MVAARRLDRNRRWSSIPVLPQLFQDSAYHFGASPPPGGRQHASHEELQQSILAGPPGDRLIRMIDQRPAAGIRHQVDVLQRRQVFGSHEFGGPPVLTLRNSPEQIPGSGSSDGPVSEQAEEFGQDVRRHRVPFALARIMGGPAQDLPCDPGRRQGAR